jgi:large subunit ribosomal protein L40e
MQIFVKLHNSKTITIEVESTTFIKEIMEFVWNKGGLPVGYQRFVFGGKPLNSDLTIGHYNIQKECTIQEFYKSTPFG